MKKIKWWPVSARVMLEFDSSGVDTQPWWGPRFFGWHEPYSSGFRVGIFGVAFILTLARYED